MRIYKNFRDLGVNVASVYDPTVLPWRGNDWCCYVDSWGADCSPYGWGTTEEESLQALHDILIDDEDIYPIG